MTRNEKILPPSSIEALRGRGHRMVLLTGGTTTRTPVDPALIADQQDLLMQQGLSLKYLPGGAAPFEQQLMEALDFMDDRDAAVRHDKLSPGDERDIKRLEELAARTPVPARALAEELWTKRTQLRSHARFTAAIAVLEALPAVAP
jgi:hypothetical protein